jgi:dihydrolipoamide dehydrogenase
MKYDVSIIGSGPGGYVAAIRCAQLGMKTALIEKYDTLGGTCLNVGCIPSKALLDSSEHFHFASKSFPDHGIHVNGLKCDLKKMVARKNEVVDQTVKGVNFLMKKNKIDVFHGIASFTEERAISIKDKKGKTIEIGSDKIIIATGSKPKLLPEFSYDKKRIITSTEALNIEKVPQKMLVIGGGIVGLELGSVFARLGTEIEIVEFLDHILDGMDQDCARELIRSLKKLGFKFNLNHVVTSVTSRNSNVVVNYKKRDSDDHFTTEVNYCLISIGRKPYTENLELEKAKVERDKEGRIIVDENLETTAKGIFAIGDVVKGPMLAHKAEEEGIFVAEYLAGQRPHINYSLIPSVVYTWPEVAGAGRTEEELKEANIPYKTGKFPFRALGRARASSDTEGMVKILAHLKTDEVLGVHMVGPRAADLIAEAVALMEFRASAEDIARICHAHPTFSEAVREAALDATEKRSLHL